MLSSDSSRRTVFSERTQWEATLDSAHQSEQILGSMLLKTVIGLSVTPWVLCGLCAFSANTAGARARARAGARAGAPDASQVVDKPRVVITTLTIHGVTPADRSTLTRSLRGGLSGAGLHVIPLTRAQKTLAGRASLLGCETSVCLKAIGDLLRAPLCARAVVEDSGGGTYRLALTLTNTATGIQVAHQVDHCAPCTTAEAAEKLSRSAKTTGLKAKATLPASPARRITRRTPPRRRQSSPGYGGGPAHKDASATARSLTIAGITLLSAGAALVGSGATLWALDGHTARSTSSYVDVYRTRTGGIVTTSVGIATTLAGAALLIYGLIRGNKRRPSVTVGFDPHRKTLLVRGSF
jgi:hypothetical protein